VRVLITGGSGQVGRALRALAPVGADIAAPSRHELDLARPERLAEAIRSLAPELIVNAAAFTEVDRAESEAETARLVNAVSVRRLAEVASAMRARFIQLSTDYVFDGTGGRPYLPSDLPCPLSVYGATKLEGERSALEPTDGRGLVLRSSWIYAPGGRNFVTTLLGMLARESRVRVVVDQVSVPTTARSLATAVWATASSPELAGIAHWTDAGVASRYDLAVAIQEEALEIGLLTREIPVEPVATADFPTPARRPLYSVLDSSPTRAALGLPALHWRVGLRRMLKEMPRG
jgi:dTDP-4-dehydrorhamnose reductase